MDVGTTTMGVRDEAKMQDCSDRDKYSRFLDVRIREQESGSVTSEGELGLC
jgi:hypothetical protein